jgi:hypothetical protein
MYFPTTQWSLLVQAKISGDASGRQALEELCLRYWTPFYRFIWARGYGEAEIVEPAGKVVANLPAPAAGRVWFSGDSKWFVATPVFLLSSL